MRRQPGTRRDHIRAAVAAIVARGEQPTSRSTLQEMGGYLSLDHYGDNGMNGQDLAHFNAAMTEQGFVRGQNGRWTR